MTSDEMVPLIRLMAVWSGLGSFAMGVQIARGGIFLVRVHGSLPRNAVAVLIVFGAASAIGVYGAYALWRLSRAGRRACIFSGVALLVGVAPAAIVRGEALVVAGLIVTLAVVMALISSPVKRAMLGVSGTFDVVN